MGAAFGRRLGDNRRLPQALHDGGGEFAHPAARVLICRDKGGGWYFGEPKTVRSRRSIPLPASILRALAEHRRKQAAERLKAGPAYLNHDLVFTTPGGGPLLPGNLKRCHFHPVLERAKLPKDFRLYDLRHTCATLLLLAGENRKGVSERLGHATVMLTLDVYSHVLPSMQQAATEELERMLFAAHGPVIRGRRPALASA